MTKPATTTQTGTPVASDAHSLTVGADGPTVLHDRYLVEKLASFNRERVPERNPPAKGGGWSSTARPATARACGPRRAASSWAKARKRAPSTKSATSPCARRTSTSAA